MSILERTLSLILPIFEVQCLAQNLQTKVILQSSLYLFSFSCGSTCFSVRLVSNSVTHSYPSLGYISSNVFSHIKWIRFIDSIFNYRMKFLFLCILKVEAMPLIEQNIDLFQPVLFQAYKYHALPPSTRIRNKEFTTKSFLLRNYINVRWDKRLVIPRLSSIPRGTEVISWKVWEKCMIDLLYE